MEGFPLLALSTHNSNPLPAAWTAKLLVPLVLALPPGTRIRLPRVLFFSPAFLFSPTSVFSASLRRLLFPSPQPPLFSVSCTLLCRLFYSGSLSSSVSISLGVLVSSAPLFSSLLFCWLSFRTPPFTLDSWSLWGFPDWECLWMASRRWAWHGDHLLRLPWCRHLLMGREAAKSTSCSLWLITTVIFHLIIQRLDRLLYIKV